MLFEQGKFSDESLSPLAQRVAIPDAWRFVLFWPEDRRGLSGESEREAFGLLPAIAPETTRMLTAIAMKEILPAAEAHDVAAFGDAIYRYGHSAGLCFGKYQLNAFASGRVAALVDAIRQLGVSGVGQSSWGPTVFAVMPDEERAQALARRMETGGQFPSISWLIASPANRGAEVGITRFKPG